MPNMIKIGFLKELENKYGKITKLSNSLSLFKIGKDCRIYIRYSKIHSRNQAFYGLRKEDLKQLYGFNAVICFLWDGQIEPLFIPLSEFEDIFYDLEPSSDGQIKVSIFQEKNGVELYISNTGRFNVESFFGWDYFDLLIEKNTIHQVPNFNHSQIQTILGAIGIHRGLDIWIPQTDRNKMDWNLVSKFDFRREIPTKYSEVLDVIKEIDIIWLKRGSSELSALFEIEHSTPIYSGLLRFNDLHLINPSLHLKYSIVSNDLRRSLYLRQINRPTFRMSGLSNICNFLEYKDVFVWYNRIRRF